ncbi:MAG: hypothetical protein WD851_05810 [Pirellulales bacterium]
MPHELVSTLEDLRRRILWRRSLCAVLTIAALLLGTAIVLGAIDFGFRISDPGLRWILFGCFVAVALLAAYRFGIVALRLRLTTLDVARVVEHQNPQFGDRLASALEFVNQAEDDRLAGSAEMRRAVVVDTAAGVERLPPGAWNKVIDAAPLRRGLAMAGVVGGLALLALVLSPSVAKLSVARLLQPWRDLAWPRLNQLDIVGAPSRLAKGQSFEATVTDRGGELPSDGQIHYRIGDDGRSESFPLQSVGDVLLTRRENVQRSFDYRVTGGDDDTMPWRTVTVVDPPRLVSFDVTAQPPEYTGLPPETTERHIRVIAGTKLSAVGVASEPLQQAAVEIADGPTIPAEVDPSSDGKRLTISNWQTDSELEKPLTTSYRMRLENRDGILGTGDYSTLRVDPDPAPEVTWQLPASDQFVLAGAVVPIQVRANDNLAIQSAALLYRLGDNDEEAPQRVEFLSGAATPPVQSSYLPDETLDQRELEHQWDLAPLELPPGTEISVLVEANDYQPAAGRTALARRIRILTLEEFDSRLADRQTRIVRELEQALDQQRSAQQHTRQLELDSATKAEPSRSDIDQLATTGLDQRQIGRRLTDPKDGLLPELEAFRNDLTNNRLERPELTQQLQQVESELSRLGQAPLPQAEATLTSARKSAESLMQSADAATKQALASALAEAGEAQTEIAATLERLVGDLQQWSDFQQFAREVARLQQEQSELRKATQSAAVQAATASSAGAQQAQAERQRITEQQSELARRLDKLQQAMEQAVPRSDQDQSSAAENIADALDQSRERGTAGKLREATRELQAERLGRAADVQQQAEEDLQALLDTLRGRTARNPEGLTGQLREAQQQLNELREELAELDRQAEQQAPAETQPQQESLAGKIARSAREMLRMGARSAGQSTEQASNSLQEGAQPEQDAQAQQESRDQADQQLAQAEQQLQDQIRRAEQELAQRKLDQLAKQVDDYMERQRTVLTETLRLDDAAQPADTAVLAQSQRELETAASGSAEEFAAQPVFELALTATAKDMDAAAAQLATGKTGRPTQQLEHSALTRLGHIADVLRSEANQPEPQEGAGQPGQGGQGGAQPPSPIDVAELKMLRLMQADLNQRTREHEATLAERDVPPAEDALSTELATQQQRLAGLVDEMIRRLSQPTPPQPQN